MRSLHPDAPIYTLLGLHAESLGAATPACGIDHHSAQPRSRGAPRRRPASTARCAASRTPAITHRLGRCSTSAKRGRAEDASADGTRRRNRRRFDARRHASAAQSRRPLLVIDGDFFRASLLSRAAEDDPAARRQAGAARSSASPTCCCGSTGTSSRARCWSAGTRSTAPTYRHKAFPPYQSGREFDDALVEQLDMLPEFVAACGFANAKARRLRGGRFPRRGGRARKRSAGGTALVASGDRDTFQLASRAHDDPVSGARRRDGADRSRRGARALRRRSHAGAGFHRAARRSVRQAARRARRRSLEMPAAKKTGGRICPPPVSSSPSVPAYCFFIAAFTGSLTFSTLSKATLRISLPTFWALRM